MPLSKEFKRKRQKHDGKRPQYKKQKFKGLAKKFIPKEKPEDWAKLNLKNGTKTSDKHQVQEDLAVGLNRSQVEAIVRNALVRYDADKTGL